MQKYIFIIIIIILLHVVFNLTIEWTPQDYKNG